MAEQPNFLTETLLPLYAFVSGASGNRQGAATAAGLARILNQGQRRGRAPRQEQANTLSPADAALEAGRTRQPMAPQTPQEQLERGQAQFRGQRLSDVFSALNAPITTGEPLSGGRQGPEGPRAPTGAERSGRLDQLSPRLLASAGLKDTAKIGQDPRQFAQDKRQALGIMRAFPAGQIDPAQAKGLQRQITQAQNQDQLTEAVAAIPLAAGAKPGSIEEQIFRDLAPEMGPLEALGAISSAKRAPEQPGEQELRRAKINKLQSDVRKNNLSATGLSAVQQRELQLEVRGDIRQEPTYKDYQGARSGFSAVTVGERRGDSVGDLAILNGITRLLDPGSVVRPSEFETARRAQGLIEQIEVIIPRVAKGEILNPDVRARYVSLAKELISEYAAVSKQEITQVYGSLLQDTGLSLDQVFVDPSGNISGPMVPQAPQAAQQPQTAQQPQAPQPPQVPAFTIKGIREKGS